MKRKSTSGLADPVSLLIVAAVGMILGAVFSSGVNTRSIVQRSQITVHGTNNVILVDFGSNTVDVSGTGGVSVPVAGGRK